MLGRSDLSATLIAELGDDLFQLFTDHQFEALRIAENIEKIGYFTQLFLILVQQFFMLEASEAVQAQLQNRLCLSRRQQVFAVVQAILRLQLIGATGIGAGALQHAGDIARQPRLREQFFLRFSRARRRFDQFNNRIDIAQGNRQTFQNMPALTRFSQQVYRAPRHHFAAVADKGFQYFLEVQQLGLTVDQRHHVDPEH